MALIDDIKARYSDQRLTNLTNPGVKGATSVNDPTLNLAITDVTSDFSLSGILLDDSNADHVRVAFLGVLHVLRTYGGISDDEGQKRYKERLNELKAVSVRQRIAPTTKSVLDPSAEQTGNRPPRPRFDQKVFDGLRPNKR